MNKVDTFMVDEDIDIPAEKQKFFKFDNIGSTLEIRMAQPIFDVATEVVFSTEHGMVVGRGNVGWISANGYFSVDILDADGNIVQNGYCSNERVIATIANVYNHAIKTPGYSILKNFKVLGKSDSEAVYSKYGIPRYTLI